MRAQSTSRLRTLFKIYPDDATIVMNANGYVHVVSKTNVRATGKAPTWKNDPTATLPAADDGKVWRWYDGRIKKDGSRGLGHWGQVKAPVVKALKDGYEWKEITCTRKDGTTYTQRRQVKIKAEKVKAVKAGYTKAQLREMFGYVRPSSRFRRPDDDLMVAMGYLRAA